MEKLYSVYHESVPAFLKECLESQSLGRLAEIDMNCGVNYTSLPLFQTIHPYSRLQHSLGVALICYHFTHDISITLAGLFHDIDTPAFSHTIDFLYGDYENQEFTESFTKKFIQNDSKILSFLKRNQIAVEQVCDYHQYDIVDNPSPHLSADRLEYTCGNGVNYGFVSKKDIQRIYADIKVGKNEDEELELVFQHVDIAKQFALLSLECGKVYVSESDRIAMEYLSSLLRECIDKNILTSRDLWTDDAFVIQKIVHSDMEESWKRYCMLCDVKQQETGIIISAKKRYIDPYVENHGRLSNICNTISDEIKSFLRKDMNSKLIGVYKDGEEYNCSCKW